MTDGETASQRPHAHTNRLIRQNSPYLLQHAHNPVDWYPWGEEAFEKARREQKPIFLSIGYYTCHWCHVMERESFESAEIAELLNRDFISIKVDREERPDVDRVYMMFVQATTGSGGWPMSVFLTPELKPFYGGTYFPPIDVYGRPSFRTLLTTLANVWKRDRERVLRSATDITAALQNAVAAAPPVAGELTPEVLGRLYEQLRRVYDPEHGGFGSAPKFPRPVVLNFLLRYYARTRNNDALAMSLHTLDAMARCGMRDQLGGGFHRYSVDERWFVPHFEKMLYDQAQLVISYCEAFQITHDPALAAVARDTLDFVCREMLSPEGGFYSAQDADSPIADDPAKNGEGAFYIWAASEIEQRLPRDMAAIFNYRHGVEPGGNAGAHDPQGEFAGRNILFQKHTIAETAAQFGRSEGEIKALLHQGCEILMKAREQRPRPPLDDKIVTAWNALMISAFARASQALDEPRYLDTAVRAARFVESELFNTASGRLLRRYRQSEAAIDGFLDDYAFLIQALLDVYEADFDVHWMEMAFALQRQQDAFFWDDPSGSYLTTSGRDTSVLLRMREDYDGAEPSPNSISALNLLRLAEFTDGAEYRDKASRTFASSAQRLQNAPEALPQMLVALDFKLASAAQIVIAGERGADDSNALLRAVHDQFVARKILLLADKRGLDLFRQYLPSLESMVPIDGKSTAYVCRNYTCGLPTNDPEVLRQMLAS